MRLAALLLLVTACGRDMPSAPVTSCPKTDANRLTAPLTAADSAFARAAGIPIVEVYVCHGIVTGKP